MDRRIILTRLLNQLESEIGLAEHTESIAILAQLKSCFWDALALVETAEMPSWDSLRSLAVRLNSVASHPHMAVKGGVRRIAASYQWLSLL